MKKQYLIITLTTLMVWLLASCSAPKKLKLSEARNAELQNTLSQTQDQLRDCQNKSALYQSNIKSLNDQLNNQKTSNYQMLNQLRDLSVISNAQAESIKKSLDNIGAKDAYINDLRSASARKDSLNMALVMNLKGVIGNMNDKDIDIKVDKGVVYIDISDKLLFKTGSYEVTNQAREVLGKVAKVLLNQPHIEFMVEGHTDAVPYHRGVLLDNWDLSVKRATSVVRTLHNEYGIPAARMTAAGRSEYIPVTTNATDEGRRLNRRTRIVILPELDQFFKLLEKPAI
ncbi:OmpA family protein [Solitalea canadensis]|nr:OmpA family protein [Solitalea canadensis]